MASSTKDIRESLSLTILNKCNFISHTKINFREIQTVTDFTEVRTLGINILSQLKLKF